MTILVCGCAVLHKSSREKNGVGQFYGKIQKETRVRSHESYLLKTESWAIIFVADSVDVDLDSLK